MQKKKKAVRLLEACNNKSNTKAFGVARRLFFPLSIAARIRAHTLVHYELSSLDFRGSGCSPSQPMFVVLGSLSLSKTRASLARLFLVDVPSDLRWRTSQSPPRTPGHRTVLAAWQCQQQLPGVQGILDNSPKCKMTALRFRPLGYFRENRAAQSIPLTNP